MYSVTLFFFCAFSSFFSVTSSPASSASSTCFLLPNVSNANFYSLCVTLLHLRLDVL